MAGMTKQALALACALFLVACPQQEEAEETMTEDTTAMEEAPAGITLADVAGEWTVRATSEAGDTVPEYRLVASADEAGWVLHLPERDPIPVRIVDVAGDSIVAEAGPFQSVVQEGVEVRTTTVYRLQDGRLVATTVARYTTTGPDSVLVIHGEGTRAP